MTRSRPRSPFACARRCRAGWRARKRFANRSRSLRCRTCASSARRVSAAASRRRWRSSVAIRSPQRLSTRLHRRRASIVPSPRRRRRVDLAAYRRDGGYRTLVECTSGGRTVDAVIGELESSALRGLGGAGFPAGRKWRIVRAEPAPRLMAVNIDEGEPGTFKDRYYLERDPHRFLEGMLIAAWAVGIDEIYVYLRDEYAACRALLSREIAALRARSAVQASAHPREARCGRLHLRGRVRDDRVDRGQARRAPPAPAVRGAGRAVRPSDARAQHGNAVLGPRHPGEGRRVVRRPGPQRTQGLALVFGVRAA